MAIGTGAPAGPTTHAELVRVFVYGTLRPGGVFWTQALAGRVTNVSATVRIDGLHLIDGPGYPLAVRGDGDARVDTDADAGAAGGRASGVVGEVVDVPLPLATAVMADLDRIEGVPALFERIDIDGVWVYVASTGAAQATRPGMPTAGTLVTSGDWFDVAPTARAAWEREMGRGYIGA
jgi:gamma-glutamylcyclotransferase (GGCT)/AIG2-like uncharacterized protein YtfP